MRERIRIECKNESLIKLCKVLIQRIISMKKVNIRFKLMNVIILVTYSIIWNMDVRGMKDLKDLWKFN